MRPLWPAEDISIIYQQAPCERPQKVMGIIPRTGLWSVNDLYGSLVEEGRYAVPKDLSLVWQYLVLLSWQRSLVWNPRQGWWLYPEGERVTLGDHFEDPAIRCDLLPCRQKERQPASNRKTADLSRTRVLVPQ